MRVAAPLLLFAACGAPDPAPVRAAPSLIATAAGPGDAIVAQVDGRPVWGSCVAAQLRRGAKDRRAALDECVDFELLAQAAERRGATQGPEVAEATRRALVSRLIEVGFEDAYKTPDDLRAPIDKVVVHYRDQLDKPELRGSTFARVEIAKDAPRDQDTKARELADRIGAALENETGLFPSHVSDTANRLAAGTGLKVTTADFRPATREALVPAYATALFSIPEVGRVAKPTRTEWGYDIILLTSLIPAHLYTRDEVAAQVFPDVRRKYFGVWVNEIIKSLGVDITINKDRVDHLDELDRPTPVEATP
jgi:hypothetical protein